VGRPGRSTEQQQADSKEWSGTPTVAVVAAAAGVVVVETLLGFSGDGSTRHTGSKKP
jgi:hypothetical protein